MVGDGGRVEVDHKGGGLRLSGLTYDNAGEYTCIAQTGAGEDDVTHTVAVEGEERESYITTPLGRLATNYIV